MNEILVLCVLMFVICLYFFLKRPKLTTNDLVNDAFAFASKMYSLTVESINENADYVHGSLYICFITYTTFIFDFYFKEKHKKINIKDSMVKKIIEKFDWIEDKNELKSLYYNLYKSFSEAWKPNKNSFLDETVHLFMEYSDLGDKNISIENAMIIETVISKICIGIKKSIEQEYLKKYKIN